jgi:hypothetical protein
MEDVKDIVVLLFLLLFDAQTTESKASPNQLNLDFVSFAVEPLTLYWEPLPNKIHWVLIDSLHLTWFLTLMKLREKCRVNKLRKFASLDVNL